MKGVLALVLAAALSAVTLAFGGPLFQAFLL